MTEANAKNDFMVDDNNSDDDGELTFTFTFTFDSDSNINININSNGNTRGASLIATICQYTTVTSIMYFVCGVLCVIILTTKLYNNTIVYLLF